MLYCGGQATDHDKFSFFSVNLSMPWKVLLAGLEETLGLNADKDPAEVEIDVARTVDEVRREMYERTHA